jgi:hydroxyacylglutathione hydrolase
MKRVNRDGASSLAQIPPVTRQAATALAPLLQQGALVVDLRPTASFARGSVPGTLNVPLNNSFVSRAGWLLPYDRDIYLIAGEDGEVVAQAAARELLLIGIERVRGWFGADALANAALPANQTIPQVTVSQTARRVQAGRATVVDVRNTDEWVRGHIPGALHIPLGRITEHSEQLPRDRQVVLQCETGARSAVAASLLLARGLSNVANLEGGYTAWQAAGLPVTRDGA